MSTLLLSHPACLEHLTPPGHPERPDRLRAIDEALADERFQLLAREQTPEDIGRAVAFLVSEEAKNITGQALNVDGGSTLN